MGSAEIRVLHLRWQHDENRQELSRHLDYIHADIEVTQPGAEPLRGLDAYRAMMEAAYTAFPDFQVVLDDQFATEDRVVCRWRVSGTHSSEFAGFPPTGRRIEYAGMSLWNFEDGRARRGWIYPDLPALMAQLSGNSTG